MTTGLQLVQRTRKHLDGAERGVLALLGGNLTNSPADDDLAITGDPTRAIREGVYLSLGLETMYVLSSPETGGAANVLRAQDGTDPIAHTSGELIRVNPRFTDAEIFAALIRSG